MAKLTYTTGWLSEEVHPVELPTTAIALHSLVKQLKKANPKLTMVLFSAELGPGMNCGFAWNPALTCQKNVDNALLGVPEKYKPLCRKAVQEQIFGIITPNPAP